jgi:hypothetical protein
VGAGLSDLAQENSDGFFNELDRGMEPLTWKTLAKELEVSHQGRFANPLHGFFRIIVMTCVKQA